MIGIPSIEAFDNKPFVISLVNSTIAKIRQSDSVEIMFPELRRGRGDKGGGVN